MSTKAEVSIHFKTKIPKVFKSKENLEIALKEFHNEKKNGRCDITVTSIEEYQGNQLEVELYSSKHQNLLFQQELLVRYLISLENVMEVNSSVWVATDEDIHLEEEELLDF